MAMRCVVEQPGERKIERPAIGVGPTIAGVILAALICGGELYAGEKKEVYVSPGADKKTLINEPLDGVPGHEVTVAHFSFPPGWVGGKHYHTGPVYVYVLEGSFTIDEQGKERQNFKAGELYREPIGAPMQARNLNASEPLKLLVFQLGPKGEPLMIKAD
jgi:quercetin dioxygenase-like cupin family protein